MTRLHLLGGPDVALGMEPHSAHVARLGALRAPGAALTDELGLSDLRGRGGAAFPVATKWASVRAQRGRAVVLANGAEGEPLSFKDRVLLAARPHLVLDGAVLAAEAVGADEIVLYVGEDHAVARAAVQRAVAERPAEERHRLPFRLVSAPARYVAGEETAAVHRVNDGVALPTSVPPRPYERGVRGRPTLVQNVETLAHVALIARHGAAWFQSSGAGDSAGTTLVTVTGAVPHPGVIEIPEGTSVAAATAMAGGAPTDTRAVLLGGYFGSWVAAPEAWSLPLDGPALRSRRLSLGCGVVHVLAADRCGVVETARIVAYLAGESARQCGPCVFGLRAIAEAADRLARCAAEPDDLARITRWAGQLAGRGACRHPDGAAVLLHSALRVFEGDFLEHQHNAWCRVDRTAAVA